MDKMRWLLSRSYLPALIALAMIGVLVGGCAPQQPAATALPPATIVGPVQPQAEAAPKPMTAIQPAPPTQSAPVTVVAPEAASPTEAPSSGVPPAEAASPAPNNPGAPRKAVQVTILHTNDVFGEVDPCG
jgi:hypothetical protein